MRPSKLAATCAVLLLSSVAAFGGKGQVRPHNLILISIDTLRADRLGCYGHRRPTSPALDALAAEGVLFEDASAPSPWTKPSHASLLTGLHPSRHGATTMLSTMSEDVVHLAQLLGQHGFHTAAVVNSNWLTSHGLERGFADFRAVDYVQGRREGSGMTDAAIGWFESRDGAKPFFAFLHYMDVHSDYASLPKYEKMFVEAYDGPIDGTTQQLYRIAEGRVRLDKRGLRHLLNLYDAGIRQVDDELGRLFTYLREQGLLDTSVVIITSDHGEEFLEHGGVIHGQTQYQEVVRVPLIVHGPGVPAGRRVAAPVSLVDVVPTCTKLFGVPTPPDLDGIALDELWLDTERIEPRRFFYYEADVTFPPPRSGPVPAGTSRAVRTGRYKLHFDTNSGRVRLFDLETDPRERVDLAAEQREVAQVLQQRLQSYLAAGGRATPTRELTEEQLEALRSLGYLGRE